MWGKPLACLLFAWPAATQQASYVGAPACRSCHPEQFARQSATAHAQTLHRLPQHPLAANFAPEAPLERPPNFHFRFLRTEEGFRVRADDGRYVTELPLEWAFGAGEHAVTFVSQAGDQFYLEHSVSFYADTKSLDITPGHERLPSETLHQAMGQPLRIRGPGLTITNCFQCHSTGPVSVSPEQKMQVNEPGVRCEVCHGPGSDHVKAAGRRDLIRNPKRLPSAELNKFCGACHRSLTEDFNWSSPWNVRHQPPYLAQSRCFQRSNGALSCLTCHQPHERVRRHDPAWYSQKCAACHHARSHAPKPACQAQKSPDCTSCHMPLVAASTHLRFKNHWIGVYQEGASLKPSR